METIQSIWHHFSDKHDFPSLQQNIQTEVAIIGGGITGITTGKLLARAGFPTVVLESNTVGSGTTSYSTGNLYYTVDHHLSSLAGKYDIDRVKQIAASRSETLQQMTRWIQDLSLDCDYKKVPWYLYSSNKENMETIRHELQTGKEAGLSVREANLHEIPFSLTSAISIPAQAQINPMRYVQETTFRWGGQHYRPADLLPFIGPVKKGSTEFIATGYSTDGLVYGTLAAHILADMIIGRDNKWAKLYDSTRKQPIKSGSKFLKENFDVASQYIKDILGPEDFPVRQLKKGEGKVIKKDEERLAVYRNEDGELEIISAVCTHMGCNVHWNNAEKSWDCPCHGSRFSTDGTVLEGPALEPLPKNPTRL